MGAHVDAGPDSGRKRAWIFYGYLVTEVVNGGGWVPSGGDLGREYGARLARYYRTLKEDEALRAFLRYNWVRRVEPMTSLVLGLPRRWKPSARETPWRILDAGCGLGTESIFWSSLRQDVEVIAVDISPDRLNVARVRQAAYERQMGQALNLQFREQDVLSTLLEEHFDLVWAMESISHIDPAEGFVDAAYQSLDKEGTLVISDSHALNPTMLWRMLRLRASGVKERTSKTLADGRCLSYAQERLFAVGQLSRMLHRAGFRSVRSQLSVFFPPALARFPYGFKTCTKADSVLTRIPLLRSLGGIYTVVASKA